MINGQPSIREEVKAILGGKDWGELERELKSPSEKVRLDMPDGLETDPKTGLVVEYMQEYPLMDFTNDPKKFMGYISRFPAPNRYDTRYSAALHKGAVDINPEDPTLKIRVRAVNAVADVVKRRIEEGNITGEDYREAGNFANILTRGKIWDGGLR